MGIRGCSVLFSWDFRCQLSPWSVQKGAFRGDGKRAAQQVAELRHGWWLLLLTLAGAAGLGLVRQGQAGTGLATGVALLLVMLVLFLSL